MRIGVKWENGSFVPYNLNMALAMQDDFKEGVFYEIKVIKSRDETKRTILQNAALYLWFKLVAACCSKAGVDLRQVLPRRAPLPVTETNFKNCVWKPVQKALFGTESTTDLKTDQVSEVYRNIDFYLLQKNGINCPFPDAHRGWEQ